MCFGVPTFNDSNERFSRALTCPNGYVSINVSFDIISNSFVTLKTSEFVLRTKGWITSTRYIFMVQPPLSSVNQEF